MEVFKFSDHKKFFKSWLKSQPKAGHGQLKRVSEHLGLSTVMVSQIFNGDRMLSLEHALKMTQFLDLHGLEKEYYLALVQKDRAGTHDLENYFSDQLKLLKKQAQDLKKVVKTDDYEMSEIDKSVFHSDWKYSAVRLITAIDEVRSISDISQALGLPQEIVRDVIHFLEVRGLVEKSKFGFELGPKSIHLENQSPYILARQKSWRLKSMECMDHKKVDDLFYTGPMALSKSLKKEIRTELLAHIKNNVERIPKTEAETLCCLNIDFFEMA